VDPPGGLSALHVMEKAFGGCGDRHEAVGLRRLGLRDDQGPVDAGRGATDAQDPSVEVDVRPSERESFAAAQPGVDEQLEQRRVARETSRIEQFRDLSRSQVDGLFVRHLGPLDRRSGVHADRPVPDRGVQDGPQHRVRRPDGRLGQPLVSELDDPASTWDGRILSRERRPSVLSTTCDRVTPAYRLFVVCFRSEAWRVVSIQCRAKRPHRLTTVPGRLTAQHPGADRCGLVASFLRRSAVDGEALAEAVLVGDAEVDLEPAVGPAAWCRALTVPRRLAGVTRRLLGAAVMQLSRPAHRSTPVYDQRDAVGAPHEEAMHRSVTIRQGVD